MYAVVKRFGARIHFQIRRSGVPRGERSPIERDAYIYVDDLAGLHQELIRRGTKVVMAPQRVHAGKQTCVRLR